MSWTPAWSHLKKKSKRTRALFWSGCCMPDMLMSHRMNPPPLWHWLTNAFWHSARAWWLFAPAALVLSFQLRCSDADIKHVHVFLPSSSPSFLLCKWKVREDHHQTWRILTRVCLQQECVCLSVCWFVNNLFVCMHVDNLIFLLCLSCQSGFNCEFRFADACTQCYFSYNDTKPETVALLQVYVRESFVDFILFFFGKLFLL